MAYTTPRVWIAGENASAVKLNEVSDNIRALKDPATLINTVRGAGANETTTSLTNVAITSLAGGNITTTGGKLNLVFNASLAHTVINVAVIIDVLIDGVTYASSLSTTQVTNGLWAFRPITGGSIYQFSAQHVIPAGGLAAGVHSLSLLWRVGAAGTGTLYTSGYVAQFAAFE